MRLLLARLTRATLVIATALCGSANATAPDRVLDETVQLNPSEAVIALKSERRSGQAARGVMAATRRDREERMHLRRAARAPMDDSQDALDVSDPYMIPHTLFGAGSIALSALGSGASTAPPVRF